MRRMRSTIRRNFDKKFQLDKVCGEAGVYRPVFRYIYFKDGHAYASNASIGIRIPINEMLTDITDEEKNILNGRFIHKSVYKKILSYDIISIEENGVLCTETETKTSVLFQFSTISNTYPELWSVIDRSILDPIIPVEKIAFSHKFLFTLCSGLGLEGHQTVLEFRGASRAIVVRSRYLHVCSIGILMPGMLNE